jgi:hypothetical protein
MHLVVVLHTSMVCLEVQVAVVGYMSVKELVVLLSLAKDMPVVRAPIHHTKEVVVAVALEELAQAV